MIDTPRLRLRRFALDDAPALRAYRNDPDIARYQAWPSPLSPEAAVDQVREYMSQDPDEPGWSQYAIELKADHRLAGDLGVHLHDNRRQSMIGFTLAPELHGQGYATEAVHAMLSHLFAKGIHRVSAECDVRNAPSARVLKRTGFQQEGQRPEYTWNINTREWTDTLCFGLLASTWHQLAAPAS